MCSRCVSLYLKTDVNVNIFYIKNIIIKAFINHILELKINLARKLGRTSGKICNFYILSFICFQKLENLN